MEESEDLIMEKYTYDESNGLWYELQGDYYLPCLKLPEEKHQPIGIGGQRHHEYLRRNKRITLSVRYLRQRRSACGGSDEIGSLFPC